MSNQVFLDDDSFFKSNVLNDEGVLLKAKKMPIGTVSRGFKKVAEGKWIPVRKGTQQKTKETQAVKKEIKREDKIEKKGMDTDTMIRQLEHKGIPISHYAMDENNPTEKEIAGAYHQYVTEDKKKKLTNKEIENISIVNIIEKGDYEGTLGHNENGVYALDAYDGQNIEIIQKRSDGYYSTMVSLKYNVEADETPKKWMDKFFKAQANYKDSGKDGFASWVDKNLKSGESVKNTKFKKMKDDNLKFYGLV